MWCRLHRAMEKSNSEGERDARDALVNGGEVHARAAQARQGDDSPRSLGAHGDERGSEFHECHENLNCSSRRCWSLLLPAASMCVSCDRSTGGRHGPGGCKDQALRGEMRALAVRAAQSVLPTLRGAPPIHH